MNNGGLGAEGERREGNVTPTHQYYYTKFSRQLHKNWAEVIRFSSYHSALYLPISY